MHHYRVTKYNPDHRDATGAYVRDDWTSFGDIGRAFHGITLSRDEYLRVESAYVGVAMTFLEEDRSPDLHVVGLEIRGDKPTAPTEGSVVSRQDLVKVCRSILREKFWCRLESGSRYLHFGWDYYMYVGVVSDCMQAVAKAKSLGLFVESFDSPYMESEERNA